MIVGSRGQGKILPQENWVPVGPVALLKMKITMLGEWLWCIILCQQQQFELHSDTMNYFKEKKPGEHQQETDLPPRHTGPTPRIMVWGAISYDSRSPVVVITCNPDCKLACQSGDLTCYPAIYEHYSRWCFPTR
ncbi:DDE_3 domain-containing protein [Trichonephila clavipes]|nr:DDE_3 domain-containing protein [Trichonephila clavipes]